MAEAVRKRSGCLRIVFFIDVLRSQLGGTENQLIKLLEGLGDHDYEPTLLCLWDDPWYQQHIGGLHCRSRVVEVQNLRRPSTYLNICRLVRLLSNIRPDVVHTFFPVSNIVGVLAARLARIPVIITSRRDYGEWMNPRYLTATRLANRAVTRIIANSRPVAALSMQREGVPARKIVVIPNGIDADAFRRPIPDPHLRSELGIPQDAPVVGIVANFRPMKQHAIFLRAAQKVSEERGDVHYILVGDGKLRREIEDLGRSFGLEAKLHLVGQQPEPLRYLGLMDVGVNCSTMEGLSNAVMEYMAAGVPAVVSRAGGNTDLVSHNNEGLVFEPGDHLALAFNILRVLNEKSLACRLATAAREKVENHLALPVMIRRHAELYRELLPTAR